MLTHLNPALLPPARVVIVGAGGFIACAIARRLREHTVPVLGLGRPGLDLLSSGGSDALASQLRPDDVLVLASPRAPCKDTQMLVENMQMAAAVCKALRERPVSQVVYVSSDAVYRDSAEPITEGSCAETGCLPCGVH